MSARTDTFASGRPWVIAVSLAAPRGEQCLPVRQALEHHIGGCPGKCPSLRCRAGSTTAPRVPPPPPGRLAVPSVVSTSSNVEGAEIIEVEQLVCRAPRRRKQRPTRRRRRPPAQRFVEALQTGRWGPTPPGDHPQAWAPAVSTSR